MVHCIGQRGTRPRPVVASFTTQQGMCMVMSYSKQLKSTPFSISEQLPPSVHEWRTAQIPQMIKLRNEAQSKNVSADIKLVKDKLIVNNKLKSDTFESNPVKYVTPTEDDISFDTIQHSTRIIMEDSVFQAHFHPIHIQKEAKQVLRALHQNKVVSDSDHVIYAYKYVDLDGQTVQGYSDDGEWNTSCILRDLLQQKGLTEAMLVVTCKYGGYKLGKKRFELIKQVANEALQSV